jgi:hypothetical protein
MLVQWSTFSALALGAFILSSGEVALAPAVFVLGYLAIFSAAAAEARLWKDVLNPLTVLLFLCAMRFSIPALLFGVQVNPQVELYQLMHLRDNDLQLGHLMAVTGMLGVSAGWLLLSGKGGAAGRLNFVLPRGIQHIALVAMALGTASLLLFVGQNILVDEAVVEGSFRTTTVEAGTGQFFFLALALISGSVLLSCYVLINERQSWWTCLIPAGASTLSFLVLGGRARAALSLIAVLLLIYYKRMESSEWKVSVKRLAQWAVIATVFALWFGNLGQLYREGEGLSALKDSVSLSELGDYAENAVFEDIGQLHALAGAASVGPGVINGNELFVRALSWPVSDLLDLSVISAGVFIVEATMGFQGGRWGVHSSVIGDAYLSYGVLGVVVAGVLFGMLIKALYVKFRKGSVKAPIYVLAAVYSFRVFLESIDKWAEALVVVAFGYATLRIAQFLFGERRPEIASGGRRSLSAYGPAFK